MILITAGSLLFTGLVCFWISLDRLSHLEGETNVLRPAPEPQEEAEGEPLRPSRPGRTPG